MWYSIVQLGRRICGRGTTGEMDMWPWYNWRDGYVAVVYTTGEMDMWPWYNWGDGYLAVVQLERRISGRGTTGETGMWPWYKFGDCVG